MLHVAGMAGRPEGSGPGQERVTGPFRALLSKIVCQQAFKKDLQVCQESGISHSSPQPGVPRVVGGSSCCNWITSQKSRTIWKAPGEVECAWRQK